MNEQEKHAEQDITDLALDELTVKVIRNDPRFGARYLEAALDEEDPRHLEIALSLIAQAQEGSFNVAAIKKDLTAARLSLAVLGLRMEIAVT